MTELVLHTDANSTLGLNMHMLVLFLLFSLHLKCFAIAILTVVHFGLIHTVT